MGYINLNEWARQCSKDEFFAQTGDRSVFLDPRICQLAVQRYHAHFRISYSYGGWMEDRRFIWKGSYLEEKCNFVHLGIDFNGWPEEEVAIDQHATVIRIDDDTPEEHGWGTRIIFDLPDKDVVLIYAHLAPNVRCKVGDRLGPDSVIGEIGRPENNGGWYCHLHVQAVLKEHYKFLLEDDLRDLDGYGNAEDTEFLGENFPDPIRFIRFD